MHPIESGLRNVALFVRSVADLADVSVQGASQVTGVTIAVPVELEVQASGDRVTRVDLAPPTQQLETSFMPVFHQLRLIVTESDAAG